MHRWSVVLPGCEQYPTLEGPRSHSVWMNLRGGTQLAADDRPDMSSACDVVEAMATGAASPWVPAYKMPEKVSPPAPFRPTDGSVAGWAGRGEPGVGGADSVLVNPLTPRHLCARQCNRFS